MACWLWIVLVLSLSVTVLGLNCDCVGVQHEAIREGGILCSSDFLPKSVVYGFGVGQLVLLVFVCCFSDPFVRWECGVMLSSLDMSPLIPSNNMR